MRISDWSSDVCSSDLGLVDQAQRTVEVVDDRRQRLVELVRERRRHLADRHHPRGEQQLFLLRLARVERLDALADVDRGQQRQRLAVVLRLAPVQRIPAPAVRRAHFGGFGVVERAVAQPRQQLLRSEEHTSELQSLMRISYAVFCLKKKKTRSQIDHKENDKMN